MAMVNRAAIKVRREAAKLTMKEASERAGMFNAAKWNDVENGRKDQNVTLDTLTRIADALGCKATDLIKE